MGGIWVLIVIANLSNGQTYMMPLRAYDNIGFGYYECQQEKENLEKKIRFYKFTCSRMGGA